MDIRQSHTFEVGIVGNVPTELERLVLACVAGDAKVTAKRYDVAIPDEWERGYPYDKNVTVAIDADGTAFVDTFFTRCLIMAIQDSYGPRSAVIVTSRPDVFFTHFDIRSEFGDLLEIVPSEGRSKKRAALDKGYLITHFLDDRAVPSGVPSRYCLSHAVRPPSYVERVLGSLFKD